VSLTSDRRAIRSLRVGVVPSTHVLDLTVGAASLTTILEREIESLRSARQRACIVNGEWGEGKSNLLSYVREYCLKRNIAVSYINLNGRAAAVNHPQRFYHRVVAELRVPGKQTRGIANLLNVLSDSEGQAVIAKWASSNAHRSELARACLSYLNGHRDQAAQIILGTDLSWADYSYKKDKAIRRIGDLGDFLRSVGYAGLMIQYDELETVGQLWNVVSRQSAYRMLHTLINLRSVWSIFATTDRLSEQLLNDESSGKLRDSAALSFAADYKKLPVLKPPVIDARLGGQLLRRIEGLYKGIYPLPQEAGLQQILDRWLRMPFRNPRRLIRHAIDHLDRQRTLPLN
jgi:hypothetical protein